jgi:hypothetical protein
MRVMTEVIESSKILKVFPSFILGKCRCGCNEDIIPLRRNDGYLQRYKHGHNNIFRRKNGFTTHRGYDSIYKPNYHSARSAGYVSYHRWTYEQYYRCCLLPWIDIHHINGDTHDNTIINLKPLTRNEHSSLKKKGVSDRKCILCNKLTYIDKNGWPLWRRHPITKEEWICLSCYKKIKYKLKSIK